MKDFAAQMHELRLAAVKQSVIQKRIQNLQCCDKINPAGTYRWRFCRNSATHKDAYGRTYCTLHAKDSMEKL